MTTYVTPNELTVPGISPSVDGGDGAGPEEIEGGDHGTM